MADVNGGYSIAASPDSRMSIPEQGMMPQPIVNGGQPGFFQNPLYMYHDPGASTNGIFQQGINAAQPSTGISPQYQTILDNIRKNQDYATGVGTSNAQSLAGKRGLAGSSIEQFGTQQAVEAASRAAQDSSSNVLLQNEAQQNQLRQLQAQLYGNRAQSLAGLGSDEVASLRNADYAQQYLQLQQSLGQQGLDISRQNIGANQDIANQNSRNGLIQSGAQILAPYILGHGGGGTPGFMGGSGLTHNFLNFGGGSTGGIPGLQGGSALTNGAAPGMFGAGGSILNTAGTSTPGFGLPGIAGWQAGTATFGDNRYTNTGGIMGAVGGSLFGPAGSAIGGFLGAGAGGLSNQFANQVSNKLGNTAGSFIRYTNPLTAIPDTVSKVSKAVSSVFPF